MNVNGTDGVWMHAVTRNVRAEEVGALAGIGDVPVRSIEVAGLVAVVTPIDLTEYTAEALHRNLGNMAWLERVAWEHHRVADALARLGPVVPTRLATVYQDEDRVRAVLTGERARFVAALDRIAGRVEWGVKAYAVAAPTEPAAPATASSARGATAGSGVAYLRRRRAQLDASEVAQQAAARGAEEAHATLAGHAEAARRHPPQDRRLSGVAEVMMLNAAYLVPERAAGSFADLVAGLAERQTGVRLELTGPWPPYSFATVDGDESRR